MIDGKLAFDGLEHFYSTMINLSTLPEEEYLDWTNDHPEFDSYKKKYWSKSTELVSIRDKGTLFDFLDNNRNILALSSDSTIVEVFGSDLMSYMVDTKGQVLLGDSVGVLTDKSLVVLSKSKYEGYNGSVSNRHETYANEKDVKIFEFVKSELNNNSQIPQSINASVENAPSSLYPTWTFFDKTYTDDKRRLHVQFEMANMGTNGWIFTVKTKSQLKGLFGIWSANNTNHHFDFKDNNLPAGINGDGPTTFTTTYNEVKEVNMIVGRSFLAFQYYFNGYAKIWSRGVPVALGAGN